MRSPPSVPHSVPTQGRKRRGPNARRQLKCPDTLIVVKSSGQRLDQDGGLISQNDSSHPARHSPHVTTVRLLKSESLKLSKLEVKIPMIYDEPALSY